MTERCFIGFKADPSKYLAGISSLLHTSLSLSFTTFALSFHFRVWERRKIFLACAAQEYKDLYLSPRSSLFTHSPTALQPEWCSLSSSHRRQPWVEGAPCLSSSPHSQLSLRRSRHSSVSRVRIEYPSPYSTMTTILRVDLEVHLFTQRLTGKSRNWKFLTAKTDRNNSDLT